MLGRFVHDDYNKIEEVLKQDVSFETAEDMVLGTNHADIGVQILAQWSLPLDIVNAVRWHHTPEAADRHDTMLDIVHVANALCLMVGVGAGREDLLYTPSKVATERLGLTSHHLEKVASQTMQWTNELAEVFGTC